MSAEIASFPEPCFHCGLEIPPSVDLYAVVLGTPRPMCCLGCCAVAEMLEGQGLSNWYSRREAPTRARAELVPDVLAKSDYLRLPDLDASFTTRSRSGLVEASILVEGLSCGACVWVIERHLEMFDGVESVRVNLASSRATVLWNPEQRSLREIIARLAEIGFKAQPDRPDVAEQMEKEERRRALIRLGVAGLATMNVMTYAIALYVGALDEWSREFARSCVGCVYS